MAWNNAGNIRGPQGPRGLIGPQGEQGPPGERGPAGSGTRGSMWYTGVGAPPYVEGIHQHLDMYLDIMAAEVWQYTTDTGWYKQGRLQGYPQLSRIAMVTGKGNWRLAPNADWHANGTYWAADRNSTTISAELASGKWRFKVAQAGYYRVTYTINGGATSAALAVKLTRNSPDVFGNTVFSWSGTSSESAVSATGVVYLVAGDTVYPSFWSNAEWWLVPRAFGQAATAVTLEYIGP